MKLKEGIDVSAFLEAARNCEGQIFFHTAGGDILNLKSMLSQYVLVSIVCNPSLLEEAQVVCTQDEDYQKMEAFLE